MPIIRKFARQGHAIPKTAAPARGPFPAEIFSANPRAIEEFEHGDSLHEALDNIRYFRCRECGEIISENEMEDHICVDDVHELRRATGYNGEVEDDEEISLTVGMHEGRPLDEYQD